MIPLCVALAYLVYMAFYRNLYHLMLTLFMAGLFVWARLKRPALPRGRLSLEAYQYVRQLHDKYSKATFNTLFICFVLLARLIFGALCVNATSAKISDMFEFVVINISTFELALLLGKKSAAFR